MILNHQPAGQSGVEPARQPLCCLTVKSTDMILTFLLLRHEEQIQLSKNDSNTYVLENHDFQKLSL